MAASFIESLNTEVDDEDQVIQTEPTNEVDTSEVVTETPQEPVIPDKYQNKTLDQIIKMHQEAEKKIGSMGQEVGEVRKLADELIKRQLETSNPKDNVAEKEDEDIDWFENPEKAVRQAVDKHPMVREATQQVAQLKQQQMVQQLQTEFPDFQSTVGDPEFAQWIQASPVRLRLYAAADNLDYDSAKELLSTWQYVKPKPPVVEQPSVSEADKQVMKADRAKAIKSVAVDTGSPGNVSAKIYRRADLIRLQLEDPNRYMALQPEIMAAYQEGRVK